MKLFNYIITFVSFVLKPGKRKLIKIAYRLRNKTGLEIGGPSKFFDLKSYFPVYVFAKRVDGVNFSTETVWEGKIEEGKNYRYGNGNTGYQFISEASELEKVKNDSYDFLLSCHSLEHVANPLKALERWNEVLKVNGKIVLVLPDKEYTFDVKRPYTSFEHLLQDYENKTTEHDSTHFEEVIKLHESEKDPNPQTPHEFAKRVENNYAIRSVHHHVFSLDLLEKMLQHCNFKVIYKQKAQPFHLIIIGEKSAG
jgi:SAM-dependent methyltransferase